MSGSSASNTFISNVNQISDTARASLGGMELINTYDFASNALSITGLSGADDYLLILDITSSTAGINNVCCYVNSDTTAANYDSQYFFYEGAAAGGASASDAVIAKTDGQAGTWWVYIRRDRRSGYYEANSHGRWWNAAGVVSRLSNIVCCKDSAAITEITDLDISGPANLTGKATLYRMGTEA